MLQLTRCPDPSCGTVAEITDRFVLGSTDGPAEHVRTHCVNRHWFVLPTSRVIAAEGTPWPPVAAPERTLERP
jgi:hypothetical protein